MNYNDQNQRHSYDNHTKQNHTNISQQNSREERRSRFVFFARQKAQWNNFCAKTKVRWIRAKKLAKKILHVIMIVHIIVTAVITTIFLLNPLNYWHAYKNPAEMEVLKNADIEARKEMVDAYQRVNRRTDKEKRDEIKRQFEKISGIKDSAKTVTENNFSGAKTVLASSEAQTTTRTVTAYNLVKEQTDNAPCIGAANQNLCYLMREKKMNICASNSHSFGAILKIPGYKGSKWNGDNTCVVLDRLSKRYANRIDISMDQDVARAKKFGVQNISITKIGYMENWSKLAPAKQFPSPKN